MATESNPFNPLRIPLPKTLIVRKVPVDAPPEEQPLEPIDPTELEYDEHGKLTRNFLSYHGLCAPMIDVFNNWITNILPFQIASRVIETDKGIFRYNLVSDTPIERPTITIDKEIIPFYPKDARRTESSYMASVWVEPVLYSKPTADNTKPPEILRKGMKMELTRLPIMLGSNICNLKGLTDVELLRVKESITDPFGYFIINGTERIVYMTESLCIHVPYLTTTKKKPVLRKLGYSASESGIVCTMTCKTFRGTTIVSVYLGDKRNIEVYLHMFGMANSMNPNTLPVFCIFRLFSEQFLGGSLTYDNMMDMVLTWVRPKWKRRVKSVLRTSIAEASVIPDIITAIKRKKGWTSSRGEANVSEEESKDLILSELKANLFPQVPETNYIEKLELLSLMTAIMAEYIAGVRKIDDRDYWGNKRLETAGRACEALFARSFNEHIERMKQDLNKKRETGSFDQFDFLSNIRYKSIEESFEKSIGTNNWGSRGRQREGVSDILKPDSALGKASLMRRVKTPASSRATNPSLRSVQLSQYGYMAPEDTPEGEACGLVKNMAVTCSVSIEGPETAIMGMLFERKSKSLVRDNYDPNLTSDGNTKVMFNGRYLGYCNGQFLRDHLVLLRRTGKIPPDSRIVLMDGILWFYVDGSRPIRPLLIVDPETGKLAIDVLSEAHDEDYYNSVKHPFDELLRLSIVEYIDPLEQDINCYIAQSVTAIREQANERKNLVSSRDRLARHIDKYLKRTEITTDIEEERKVPALELREQIDVEEFYKILEEEDNIISLKGVSVEDEDGNTISLYDWKIKVGDETFREIVEENKYLLLENIRLNIMATMSDVKINLLDYRETYPKSFASFLETNPGPEIKISSEKKISYAEAIRQLKELNESIVNMSRTSYTHCEMDPSAIYGIATTIVPAPQTLAAPRVGFADNHARQAAGIRLGEYFAGKTLALPSRALVDTQFAEFTGNRTNPAGRNVMLAIMTYGGHNQEDSIIFNQASVDRGLFQLVVLKIYRLAENKLTDHTEKIANPLIGDKSKSASNPEVAARYHAIDENGLPRPGAFLKPNDCVVGKVRYLKTSEEERWNVSTFMGVGEMGVVDEVIDTVDSSKCRTITVRVRTVRHPQKGDKFASRYAQKGTIGTIMAQHDMPFIVSGPDAGISPDLIINPHCMPSRMTIGQLIEMVIGTVGAIKGKYMDMTAFRKFNLPDLLNFMASRGYSRKGEVVMRNGVTGEMMKTTIFYGPCYYQALRHHVVDKIQARGRGEKVSMTTRQPRAGRGKGGGLRVGEMERDAMISHGASSLIMERYCIASDRYRIIYCRSCGTISSTSGNYENLACRVCKTVGKFGQAETPYNYKLIIHTLAGAGIRIRHRFVETKIIEEGK